MMRKGLGLLFNTQKSETSEDTMVAEDTKMTLMLSRRSSRSSYSLLEGKNTYAYGYLPTQLGLFSKIDLWSYFTLYESHK